MCVVLSTCLFLVVHSSTVPLSSLFVLIVVVAVIAALYSRVFAGACFLVVLVALVCGRKAL